ncbi:MAG: radical SAM protein [Elusimicrobiaceae bacterium]|nr:radical SAM protein [Elusimicrobiaceae bacterium]
MSARHTLWCAVWELTLGCNLRCIHCGATAGSPRENELTTEEALALCDDLNRAGCRGVALMGGEPFLRPDWLAIAKRIRKNGMELSVITNGLAGTPETADRLAELAPRAVAVSLDAGEPALHDRIRGRAGAFESAWAFIGLCLARKLPVSVITTVHKQNIGELEKLETLLAGKNIAWQIQTAGGEGKRFRRELLLDGDEFYSVGLFIANLRRKYKPHQLAVIGAHDLGYHSHIIPNLMLARWEGCQAGIRVLGIRSDGGVKGCLAMNDDYLEGNIRRRPVSEIWADPGAFAYNRRFDPRRLGSNCAGCDFARTCRGGCNEMSLMATGVKHNDPYCFLKIEKKFLEAELRNPVRRAVLKLRQKVNRKVQDEHPLFKLFGGKR